MTGRALIIIETQEDRAKAARWAQGVPFGSRIEFKETKRSLPQNDMMWALLTEVAQQLEHGGKKYDPAQWKAIFLHAFGREISFLPSLDMKTFLPIELSSSDLSKDEMTNLIEFIIKEGTERGVVFHIPKDSHPGEPPSAGTDDPTASESSEPDQTPSLDLVNEEPACEPSPNVAGSSSPSTFEFYADEVLHLKDYARKALALSVSNGIQRICWDAIDHQSLNYRKVIYSVDGRKAMEAMKLPFQAIMDGKRSPDQARNYIARDILGCEPIELEGRK